jgi:hypothetical protein
MNPSSMRKMLPLVVPDAPRVCLFWEKAGVRRESSKKASRVLFIARDYSRFG